MAGAGRSNVFPSPAGGVVAGWFRRPRARALQMLVRRLLKKLPPVATGPSQARTGFAIMILVLLVAVGLIAAMFVTTPRYDGSSPVPVSER